MGVGSIFGNETKIMKMFKILNKLISNSIPATHVKLNCESTRTNAFSYPKERIASQASCLQNNLIRESLAYAEIPGKTGKWPNNDTSSTLVNKGLGDLTMVNH